MQSFNTASREEAENRMFQGIAVVFMAYSNSGKKTRGHKRCIFQNMPCVPCKHVVGCSMTHDSCVHQLTTVITGYMQFLQ